MEQNTLAQFIYDSIVNNFRQDDFARMKAFEAGLKEFRTYRDFLNYEQQVLQITDIDTLTHIYNMISYMSNMEVADGESMIPMAAESIIILKGKIVIMGSR